MDDVPGSSNRKDERGVKLFERRSTRDLIHTLPECKSSKMVENLNDVFEIVEDKLGAMCRVVTSFKCNDGLGLPKQFSPSETLRRVVDDCQTICSLLKFQKLKLAEMKHGIPITMTTTDAMKETSMLRKLVTAKRKLPVTPWTNLEREKKKRKLYDNVIENVYRSVYKALLLFPSPIFKMTEFVKKMRALPAPNRFSDDQIQYLVPELRRRKLISAFPIENATDVLIVKEMSNFLVEPNTKQFSLTLKEYVDANVPNTLADLKTLIYSIEKSIVEQMDNTLWAMLANLIIATVVKDAGTHISHDELPVNLPKSVMKAVTTLTQIGFLELYDNADRTVMKFAKRVNSGTLDKLGRVFGHPITSLLPRNAVPVEESSIIE